MLETCRVVKEEKKSSKIRVKERGGEYTGEGGEEPRDNKGGGGKNKGGEPESIRNKEKCFQPETVSHDRKRQAALPPKRYASSEN